MEWLMFFFRPPLTSMVFQWFWYRWTITIECFWRAQPLVSMVFQWFLKFWGQWSTMVWRLTMVCTYHRTKKCVKSIHDKMQISSRARKWTSQNISSLDPFKPNIQYNREKATFISPELQKLSSGRVNDSGVKTFQRLAEFGLRLHAHAHMRGNDY